MMLDPEGIAFVKALVLAGAGYFLARTALIALWFAAIHIHAVG
jgi:hypothetical protein